MHRIELARTKALALALGVTLVAPLGCGGEREASTPDVAASGVEEEMAETAEEAREAMEAAGEYTDAEREAFLSDARDRLDEIEREIASLRERATGEGGDALSETADALERAQQQATARLEALREASADQWEGLRDDVEQRIDDLERRYEEAAAST
jgi:hypothetical protein